MIKEFDKLAWSKVDFINNELQKDKNKCNKIM